MNRTDLKIVLLQSDIIWEDIGQNLSRFMQRIKGISSPVDLIVLPEMFNTGFTTNTLKCAETMTGDSIRFLEEAARIGKCTVIGSLLIREENSFYNRLICMFPDGTFRTYDKRHLFRLSEEYKVIRGGKGKILVPVRGWNCLPLVCYDLRFPVWSKNAFRDGKYVYDLIVYPSNWPKSRAHVWKTLLTARAIENQAYVVGLNRIGEDGYGTPHGGGSLVIDPKGMIIAEGNEEEQDIEAILSMEELELFRESFKIGLDWDRFTIEI
jgi:omega-amidase